MKREITNSSFYLMSCSLTGVYALVISYDFENCQMAVLCPLHNLLSCNLNSGIHSDFMTDQCQKVTLYKIFNQEESLRLSGHQSMFHHKNRHKKLQNKLCDPSCLCSICSKTDKEEREKNVGKRIDEESQAGRTVLHRVGCR